MCLLYLGLSGFVFFLGKNRNVSKGFILFTIFLTLWSFGLSQYFRVTDLNESVLWINFVYICGSFIASTYLLFSFVYPTKNYKLLSIKTAIILFPSIAILLQTVFNNGVVDNVLVINNNKYFTFGPTKLFWELQFKLSLESIYHSLLD